MRSNGRACAVIAMLAVVLVGCSGESDARDTTPTQPAPCDGLTTSEISRAFGMPVTVGERDADAQLWNVGPRYAVELTRLTPVPGTSKEFFQTRKREVRKLGPVSNVRRVGDEAYFQSDPLHGSLLYVRKGEENFLLSLASVTTDLSVSANVRSNLGLASPAKARKLLSELARANLCDG